MVTHDNQLDEESIFLRALEMASPGERAGYLDTACGGAPALRSRVDALLAAHQTDDRFLETPPERLEWWTTRFP